MYTNGTYAGNNIGNGIGSNFGNNNTDSIGNYTFSVYTNESEARASYLVSEFKEYEKDTNEITVSEDMKNPGRHHILYQSWNGITWTVGTPYEYVGRRWCRIEAHINPKVLTGIDEHAAMSPVDYLRAVETNFDVELRKISNILKDFSSFKIGRGRYYIDFDMEELDCPCTSESMLVLLNQGNIPFVYDEYKKHCKDFPKSYMSPIEFQNSINESVVVNFYEKYPRKKNKKSFNRGYNNRGHNGNSFKGRGFGGKCYNSRNQDNSSNSIRFEVNYNYRNSPTMEQFLTENSDSTNFLLNMMFSNEVCRDIICDYFNWTVMQGDYHSLDYAEKTIKNNVNDEAIANRLINTLKLISTYKGISKTKESLDGDDLTVFNKSLHDLNSLNINPVIIPEGFNVKFVQNLLDSYINGARRY